VIRTRPPAVNYSHENFIFSVGCAFSGIQTHWWRWSRCDHHRRRAQRQTTEPFANRTRPFLSLRPHRGGRCWSQRDQHHQLTSARYPKVVAMVALRPSPSSSAASDDGAFREPDAPFLSLRPHRRGRAGRSATSTTNSTSARFPKRVPMVKALEHTVGDISMKDDWNVVCSFWSGHNGYLCFHTYEPDEATIADWNHVRG
jgi:hypothetical protein